MLAFFKGMGEYIGGTIVGRVIVIAVTAGTVATGGVVAYNQTVSQQAKAQPMIAATTVESDNMSDTSEVSDTSSAVSTALSSTVSSGTGSETTSSDVDETISKINAATDSAVSKIQVAADSAVSQVQAAQSSSLPIPELPVGGYAIINPSTGNPVSPSDPNYNAYKTELGGDAGTVDPNKSTAIAAARAKLAAEKATASAVSSSSAASAASSK